MPVISGRDKKGKYLKWGKSGKKYYYNSEASKKRARVKALEQARAIYASGYQE